MKKIISILLSILLTVVIFGILDVTKILLYNTLITYYISFIILLAMFLILFLKVFSTTGNNNTNIPSVSSNVNTFNTIKKENTQPVSNTDISSQKANFDLSSGSSAPVQEASGLVQDGVVQESPKPEYNESPVQDGVVQESPKPEYNESPVQDGVVQESPKPEYNEPPVQETTSQSEKDNLPYTDIFGNQSKPVQDPKPVENTEVHDIPKQDLNVDNFPKDKDKKKGFVPLSTFDEVSKDEE